MGDGIFERKKFHGLFLTSCPVHTVLHHHKFFEVTANGKTAQQALLAWALYCKDKRFFELDNMPRRLRNHTENQPLNKAFEYCIQKENSIKYN